MRKKKYFVGEIIAFIVSLIFLIPIVYVFINACKNLSEASEGTLMLPKQFALFDNIKELMQEVDLLSALKNSIVYTVLSVILILITASSVAFIIQRRANKFTGFLYNICLLSMIIPFFAAPTFFLLSKTGLIHSVIGPVLVYTALSFSMSVFLLTGFYKSIPREIDEAAFIDGCGIFSLFTKIIIPLSKPMLITVTIIQTINIWNDFGVSVYLMNTVERQTLVMSTYLFYSSTENMTSWNLLFTNIVLTSLPIILVYLVLQKKIIAGMVAGAVKG